MSDPAVQPIDVHATINGTNAFGLQGISAGGGGEDGTRAASTRVIMVYLHHNASHSTNVTTGIVFGNGVDLAGCTGEWINPIDGLSSPAAMSSQANVAQSPPFAVDAALRLTCTGTPPSPPSPSLLASSPPPPTPSPGVGGTRYKHWASVQGANYVPSYSVDDVKDIFRPSYYNATTINRELGYAKMLAVNSLRVFVTHGGFASDNRTADFLKNYQSFQQLAKAHGLTLMVTLGTGERAPLGQCNETTAFVNAIVGAEVPGVVIAYEADNEPTSYMFDYLINCTLPALNTASLNPNVDISVGLAHVGEVTALKDHVTTLNWHSYNGKDNGGGLHSEIKELQKYVNKEFNPPKQLVLTEWLARPAQPLAAAFPVIRDNGVAAYNWALVIVDCTTHWNRPVSKGDPVFQGMVWPNGTVYDDLEEGECMRSKCATLQYVHHCCNNPSSNGTALDNLWSFSNSSSSSTAELHLQQHSDNGNGSDWQTKVFGSPNFKLAGPREGSMRWTNTSGASVVIGPLPSGTKRVALYLPLSQHGAEYTVQLDGVQIHEGTTEANTTSWVARTVLSVDGGKMLKLTVANVTGSTTQFSVSGATFFSSEGASLLPAMH